MPPPGSRRYLLAGSPKLVAALTELAGEDPDLRLVSATEYRLTVEMPQERAELLRQALRGHLGIDELDDDNQPQPPEPPLPRRPR